MRRVYAALRGLAFGRKRNVVIPPTPPSGSHILTEAGDFLTTEAGDRFIVE